MAVGIAGREPLLSPNKTAELIRFISEKEISKLKAGVVTNGTLLKRQVLEKIALANPMWVDVSLDGTEKEHDYIRGESIYKKVMKNLSELSKNYSSLAKKLFVSFTLMKHNKNSLEQLAKELEGIRINRGIFISKYTPQLDGDKTLEITDSEVAKIYQKITKEGVGNFKTILLGADYDLQKGLIDGLIREKVIDTESLFIDEYGATFNRHEVNSSEVLEYEPVSRTLSKQAIRISHDGYVAGCEEMFHKDYPPRTAGNLREKSLREILRR